MNSLCYAEQRFMLQARALTFAAAIDIFVSVPAGVLWGAPGVVAVSPVMFAVQWAVFRSGFGRLPWRFDPPLIRTIAAVGLPIAVVWFANTNLIGVDKLVILWGLGTQELGLYSIAAVSGLMVTIGPNAVSQMLQPRILHRFGQEGLGPGSIRLVQSGQAVAGAVAGGLVAVGCALAPSAVALLLPTYTTAVPAAVVLMIASAILSTITPVVGYFIIHDRQMWLAGAYIGASLFNVLVDVLLIRAGLGILGVAFGSLFTYFALYFVVQLLLLRLTAGTTTLKESVSRVVAPILFAFYGSALGVAAYAFSRDARWTTGLVSALTVGLGVVPLVLAVGRRVTRSGASGVA